MIKVTLGEKPKEEKPFPKLMTLIGKGGVFYFCNEKSCICLLPENDPIWETGEYSTIPHMPHFTDYNEPVTLQNA